MTALALEWEVQPMRLARARKWIVERHPGTARIPARLPESKLAQLRARVESASGVAEALDSLAATLTPREVRGLVTGIEQWEPLRRDVAVLLWKRRKPALILPLWNAWQRFPRVSEISGLLSEFTKQWGWTDVIPEELVPLVAGCLHSENPGRSAQQWLAEKGLSYSDVRDLIGAALLPQSQFDRLLREAVLTDGSLSQLKREGVTRIAEWSRELSPELHLKFGQNLLMKWGVHPDLRVTLMGVAERYGLPRRPRVERFWEPIDDETKQAFQRLLVQRRIRELFHSDTYRREYWERWTDHLSDVQRGTVEGVEYGLLDFGTFGVVEFFETGHAAYFYSEERFSRIIARRVNTRSDLRERYHPRFTPFQDNRLIHNPVPRGWYSHADRMVQRWMQATRRG